MSTVKVETTNSVLKLRPESDQDKTLEQRASGQYSLRNRYQLNHLETLAQAAKAAKVDKEIILSRSRAFLQGGPYNDFRDDLINNGFAVVRGAIPRPKAEQYEALIHDWVKSFKCSENLDLSDPSTWVEENLPAHTSNNIYSLYASSHEKFMWDARQEPGVVDAFAKIWGTDELIVSFDGFNFTLPHRKDVPESEAWPHVDQSPLKEGMQCVQGIINLSNATGSQDASLIVYKGSNNVLEEFFETQTNKDEWITRDYFSLTPRQLKWFEDKGCEMIRVSLEPGDLIVWDSRTIHYGGAQGPESNQIRTIIYASYSPREFAHPESLTRKARVFKNWKGTTHWAHDNIIERNYTPLTANFEVDPEARDDPVDKPELTDKLLKLAGVLPY